MAVANTTGGPTSLDRVFSTTMESIRPELAFELSQAKPTIAHLFNGGAVKYGGTGSDYKIPVAIQPTKNIKSHKPFQPYAATPEDSPDTARWDYDTHQGITRGFIKLSKDEMAKNSQNEYQVLNLVNAKKAIVLEGLAQDLTSQLFGSKTGASAGDNDMFGLQDFVPDTAEASQTGSVAGIPRQTYAKWRSRRGQIDSFNNNGEETWAQVMLDCSKLGRSRPDLMPTDEDVYLLYDRYLQPSLKDQDMGLADLGFDNLLYRGVPVVIEAELNGTGFTYFLTTTGKRRPREASFSMKPEHFKLPGRNPKIAENLQAVVGLHLVVMPDHDFKLEGPYDLGWQEAALQWNFAFAGFPATGSLQRLGLTSFTGAVQ